METRLQIFKPDVMTLDIHMPEMTGVELLRFLGPKLLVPTIIISSISIDESPLVLTALELGAVDYIQKPSFDQIKSLTPVFIEKVRTAAKAKVFSKTAFMAKNPTMASGFELDPNLVLVIGSSTGGTEALKSILTQFPANIPPVLIVQHIPATFSKAFADRMNNACKCRVKEAEDGEEASPGKVLIAPGGKQMSFKKKSGKLIVQIDDSPPVNRHKPSVDVLFRAAANELGKNVVGVILTGMGSDGAAGLLEMKQRGAKTIAQNEESCVVFGMPKAAIQAGAVETIVHLKDIPEEIFKLLSKKKRAA